MKRRYYHSMLFFSGMAVGIALLMLTSFQEEASTGNADRKSSSEQPKWAAPALPAAINFSGETTPLERWEVKEQLDREILFNYYLQNNILYMMKLSSRYFPQIEATLKARGIPDDFKYLCIAESNLTNAISRSGATGFWQFLKGTAPGYNLEISATVDERYHVKKSTEAACVYFRQAYNQFGSWTSAAAAYNCGMGRFGRDAAYQQSRNYYDLLLPEETQRYIFRILAFKYLLSNADSLGFSLPAEERYSPVKTRSILVNSIPDLASFARKNGTDYKMLKWLNPWLRGKSLVGRRGKQYEVLVRWSDK